MKFYTNFFSFGQKLFVRGYENGMQTFNEYQITPTLYTETRPSSFVETSQPEQYNMFGEKVYPTVFPSPRDARDFVKSYSGSGMKIWGYPRFDYAKVNELYPGEMEYDATQVRSVFIDIETTVESGFPDVATANEDILLITVGFKGKEYTFGAREYVNDDANVTYIKCTDEEDLLRKFITMIEKIKPDVITGWNSAGFDLPYLYNRIVNVLGEENVRRLSPFGKTRISTETFKGRESFNVEIYGVCLLDYLELYRKFELSPRENYRLDTIAEIELGARKLEYDCTFKELYDDHWQEKFVPYNVQDVRLVSQLDSKLGFIALAMSIAFTAKSNANDVFRVTRVWDSIIANHLVGNNRHVITDYRHFGDGYEGALVKDTIPGLYEWCVTYDIGGLYPAIIIGHNMSPETILPSHLFHDIKASDMINNTEAYQVALADAKERNASLAANGSMYSKDTRGFLPELLTNFKVKRKLAQKERVVWEHRREEAFAKLEAMSGSEKVEQQTYLDLCIEKEHFYDKTQHAIKILMNSMYGAMGTQYFRLYNVHIAEGITLTGQATVTQSFKLFNDYMNGVLKTDTDYIVASDTDSCMIDMTAFVNKVIPKDDTFEMRLNKIQAITDGHFADMLEKTFDEFALHTNAWENSIVMDREGITSALFIAKKNYVMKVYDKEGTRFATPQYKITGLEAIKSSTPAYFRDKLKDGYTYVFDKLESDVHKFVTSVHDEYMNLAVEEIAGTTSVTELVKYMDGNGGFISGTPAHVRGAIAYNKMIDDFGLGGKYTKIRPGDKIKIAPLVKQNPVALMFTGDVKFFCYVDKYPYEMLDDKYIDRYGNYEKYFVVPFQRALSVINWKAISEPSLSDFF